MVGGLFCFSPPDLCARKVPTIFYEYMHSGGLELLTYTRLEDDLIRHRGDRLTLTLAPTLWRLEVGKGGLRRV